MRSGEPYQWLPKSSMGRVIQNQMLGTGQKG